MKSVSVLDLEKNRYGKKPFTTEERLERLNRIYDGSLCWLEDLVNSGNTKGTGAVTMILGRVKIEINDMVRANGINSSDQTIILEFEPIPVKVKGKLCPED